MRVERKNTKNSNPKNGRQIRQKHTYLIFRECEFFCTCEFVSDIFLQFPFFFVKHVECFTETIHGRDSPLCSCRGHNRLRP